MQRHNGILSLLEEMQTINVSHIIDNFSVSPATARRDIAKFEERAKDYIKQSQPINDYLCPTCSDKIALKNR